MNENCAQIDWQEVKNRLRKTELALQRALEVDKERLHAVYRERARRLAQRKSFDSKPENRISVLTFTLGKERYGIELNDISEVLQLSSYTHVPGLPAEYLGVFNLRGVIRPVLSLRRMLGLVESEHTAMRYLVLVRNGRRKIGLETGNVEQVADILVDDVKLPKVKENDLSYHYLKGITSEALLLVKTEAIIAHHQTKGEV